MLNFELHNLPIGVINLKSLKITTNNPIKWNCESSGRCCEHFNDIPVSIADINRIVEKTKLKVNEFTEERQIYVKKDNNWKKQYYLKKMENKSCVFQNKKLCSIHEFKPLNCRFYPFSFSEEGNMLTILIHEANICGNLSLTDSDKQENEAIIREVHKLFDIINSEESVDVLNQKA
jgi:uncharacterized protein